MKNKLFMRVPRDQWPQEWAARAEQLAQDGLRLTAVRYLPTGAVDYIVHDLPKPRRSALRGLAEIHLMELRTGGVA